MWQWIGGLGALWFGAVLLLVALWSRFWQHQRRLLDDENSFDRQFPWLSRLPEGER